MKILLSGGGTAGHVMPHIALMKKYKENFDDVVYIGSKNGMEEQLIKPCDIKFYKIDTVKLVRGKIFANLLIPFKLIKGVFEAKKILKNEKPNIVFSKGGYVALPVVIAAKQLKIPVVTHESDLNMGLANRLSKRKSLFVLTTFEETAKREKNGIFTGGAMRENMFIDKLKAKEKLHIVTNKPVLVVTGGSLGSKFINDKIRSEIKSILDKFYVIHITGKNNLDKNINLNGYRQYEFVSDMGTVLSASDIVVSRAGSNTIYELAVLKKPMLLIPLPKGASRGDQVDNAKYYNSMGYADFVTEDCLQDEPIFKYIMLAYNDRNNLIKNLNKANLEPANEKIIKILVENAKK